MGKIELKPIKETTEDYEACEEKIKELFRRQIYFPVLAAFAAPKATLQNSLEDLVSALQTGRITFNRGTFSGRFNSAASKELRSLGAKWDRKTGTWKIPQSSLPVELRSAIAASDSKFRAKIAGVDKTLSQMLPEEIADKLHVEKIFDRSLWKTDREFQASVEGITVAPQLTPERRAKIASEWQTNMRLWIKDFTEKEIQKLRKDLQASVFAGNRYESAISAIKDSYGVSDRKAKFLARQETALLMTTFKQTRYQDSGVEWYRWKCVAGSKNHPVRPWHKDLENKEFRWDNPPITTKPGEAVRRNNPGQDYNCRCFAVPIVRFDASRGKR